MSNEDFVVAEFEGVKVTITHSAGNDGAIVVFVDTTFEPDGSDGPGLRILLNDGDVYEGVPYREDPTQDMDDEQLAAHNEAMATDPQYRDAMYYERN